VASNRPKFSIHDENKKKRGLLECYAVLPASNSQNSCVLLRLMDPANKDVTILRKVETSQRGVESKKTGTCGNRAWRTSNLAVIKILLSPLFLRFPTESRGLCLGQNFQTVSLAHPPSRVGGELSQMVKLSGC